MHRIIATAIAVFLVSSAALAHPIAHQQAALRVAQMVSDPGAQRLARQQGLNVVNVMWEDTGRWQNSALGPNISDVTIEVETDGERGHSGTHLMPVLRYPNFSDETADVDLDEFFVRVGNERGAALEPVALRELLARPQRYLSLPSEGVIKGRATRSRAAAASACTSTKTASARRFRPSASRTCRPAARRKTASRPPRSATTPTCSC